MIKREHNYINTLKKFLASVLGGPLYEGGLQHMLGYFSDQVTTANK